MVKQASSKKACLAHDWRKLWALEEIMMHLPISINCGEFLDWLRMYYEILKKNSAPRC